MKRVHIVCFGNVCRSPMLEEILRSKAKEKALFDLQFSSSGLSDYHTGKGADPRMVEAAKNRGYLLENHKVKKFEIDSFEEYDLILAVTRDILEQLLYFREMSDGKAKLLLATTFSEKFCDQDIPDPYLGGDKGFSQVIDLCEDAALGLLNWLKTKSF